MESSEGAGFAARGWPGGTGRRAPLAALQATPAPALVPPVDERPAAAPRLAPAPPDDLAALERPSVRGKFLYGGRDRLLLRGVTYGTFRADERFGQFPAPDVVRADFAAMSASGVNAVRTYTVPPGWLLDAAGEHGLRVLVGLPWEQHVAFLDDRALVRSIESRVRAGVRACSGHPALLAYTIGNEVPAPIVRWHGGRRTERFLRRLHEATKEEDPGSLATYVNFPSTEYLDLSFVDFLSFNVYLESQERLAAYLARLQNIAGDRPLVMAEIGLDSRRNGEGKQAEVLDWQVATAFSSGCAGAFVFAWTDEWHRGGHDIEDWDFGLTTRDRRPKAALAAVSTAFARGPFTDVDWPRVSVVVCAYNAERTIGECLDGVAAIDYPDYEVVVVDDGSTDATAEIAAEHGAHVVRTPNRGLSSARNTGLFASTGEIVAYLDSDAFPDPHWLRYLARSFQDSTHAGIGGPNIAPLDGARVAQCVARAPGGPTHVLVSDLEAEHIPGCNMAFRREALVEIGGFDPRYDAAGDDVDVCWRLIERGSTLGFSPAAMVWHHPRGSVPAYWRQQRGYGRAEALLERRWPEKYNAAGHVSWEGRLYAGGPVRALFRRRDRVYHGTWNTGLFQRVYEASPGRLGSLTLMPEWHVVSLALGLVGLGGALWRPLLAALALAILAGAASAAQALAAGARAAAPDWRRRPAGERVALMATTGLLHLVQPLARLSGRLRHGLTPWRTRGPALSAARLRRSWTVWSERWEAFDARLRQVEAGIADMELVAVRGGDYDAWDLDVRGGLLAGARLRAAVEEHGAGRQLLRFRVQPRATLPALLCVAVLVVAAAAAAAAASWAAAVALAAAGGVVAARTGRDCLVAVAALHAGTLGLGDEVAAGPRDRDRPRQSRRWA
jgi:glycosyltransferase involved in cell wall biosynthesis